MYDLGHYAIYNKRRRGRRGAKKRQSVLRAEINLEREADDERFCRFYCSRHEMNLNDYKIEHDSRPWGQTKENILVRNGRYPYNHFAMRRLSGSKRLGIIKNNIKVCEEHDKAKNERSIQ